MTKTGVALKLKKGLPLGSGLGSSAASAAAAAWAVNLLFGEPCEAEANASLRRSKTISEIDVPVLDSKHALNASRPRPASHTHRHSHSGGSFFFLSLTLCIPLLPSP